MLSVVSVVTSPELVDRSDGPSGRLAAKTISVAKITPRLRDGMWNVFRRYYADVSRENFERDLSKKTDVILLLDSGDQSIQGFSTLEVYDRRFNGRSFISVFSGDTVVEEAYWGQSALQREFVRYVVSVKLRNPFRAVYWFLISKGYKTYLLLSRNYWNYWPRWSQKTPEWESSLISELATEKYGKAYDARTGVLRFEVAEGRLKDGVAPIDEKLLAHPDIAYFCDRNPGHTHGDELCCLGKVDALLWLKFTMRLLKKVFMPTRKTLPKRQPQPRLPSVAS